MALKLGGGGSAEDTGEASEIMAEINITPLVDVFLVLLIIFMVTSSVMSQLGVDVSLPQASPATAQAQSEGVIVTLLPGGRLQVNGQAVAGGDSSQSRSAFQEKLKGAFESSKSRLVILEGDREAFLGSAIEVMDWARQAGAEKFAIATAPEK